MAQGQTASRSSRSQKKSSTRSGGSSSKSRKRTDSKPKQVTGKANKSSPVGAVENAAKEAGETAKDAGRTVGRAASKAKVPLLAGGAALAGAAGGMWGMLFPITPIMGGALTLKSFVVAVLGGLGTMMGAIVGGLVLGLAKSLTCTYLGPTYPNAISFGLLVLILIVRPTGILGRRA